MKVSPHAGKPAEPGMLTKIYAESFRGADHLRRILEEAQAIVGDTLAARAGKWLEKIT